MNIIEKSYLIGEENVKLLGNKNLFYNDGSRIKPNSIKAEYKNYDIDIWNGDKGWFYDIYKDNETIKRGYLNYRLKAVKEKVIEIIDEQIKKEIEEKSFTASIYYSNIYVTDYTDSPLERILEINITPEIYRFLKKYSQEGINQFEITFKPKGDNID